MENQTLWADYIITRKRVAERSRQDKTSKLCGTLSFCSNGQQRIAAMTEIDTAAVVGVPHPRWDERPIAVACRWEIFYDIFEQVCLSKCVYFVTIILKMHEERTHMHPLLNLSVLTWKCVCVCALTTAVCLDSSAILRPRLSRWRKLKARRISWRRQGGLKRSKSPEQSQHMDAYGTLYIRRKFSETSPSYGRMRMVSFHIMSTTEVARVARVCKSNFCSWEVDTAVSENIRSQ